MTKETKLWHCSKCGAQMVVGPTQWECPKCDRSSNPDLDLAWRTFLMNSSSDRSTWEAFVAAWHAGMAHAKSTRDETSRDDPLVADTIAQNTRLLSALTKVTESWVNGRRVLDGIPASIAQEVREALKLHPTVATLTPSTLDALVTEADKYILPVDVKIGAATFRKGVKVGTMLRGLKTHAERELATAYSPLEPSG